MSKRITKINLLLDYSRRDKQDAMLTIKSMGGIELTYREVFLNLAGKSFSLREKTRRELHLLSVLCLAQYLGQEL